MPSTRRRSRVGTLGPGRSVWARMVSKNIRPMPKTATPAIPPVTQVLSFVDRGAAVSTFDCRRFGPFHTLLGTQRVTNAKASDAHTGHTCCSCNSSQSRHSRAVRSCMHNQFTTHASCVACYLLARVCGGAHTRQPDRRVYGFESKSGAAGVPNEVFNVNDCLVVSVAAIAMNALASVPAGT